MEQRDENKMKSTKFEYREHKKEKKNVFLFLPPPLSSPPTHSSSIPPSRISLHEPPVSLSLSLLVLLSLPSHLFTHTHAHTPESFPLLPLTRAYYPLSLETDRNKLVFFPLLFLLLASLCCWLCAHLLRHHPADASP